MALSDEQRVRYARHLLLPELGETGQLKLLEGCVRFAEGIAQEGREVAGEYLRRAGVRVVEDEHAHGYVDVIVDGDGDGDGDGDELILSPPRLACDPSLVHAAQAVSGAFAAVEAIKRLAAIGRPGALDRDLLLVEEV